VVVGSITAPGQILALPGASESTVVMVEPTRVLDTRYNIGLTGQVVASTSHKLVVTGVIDTYIEATTTIIVKQVVPAGATGVLLNVTAVSPTATGFLSIRPGTATGVPATAGLNFNPGDVVPNAVTVALPIVGANAGKIDIYYGAATVGATLHVVADVVGYTTNTGLVDLTNRLIALETSGVAGPNGPQGPTGANGAQGPAGNNGLVDGSACAAGGIAGTIQAFFDATTGSLALRCSRAQVTTLAGTAGSIESTDGTGAAARFKKPYGVAVDAAGNVYVADTNNHTIRKITSAGVVTTLAGTAGSIESTDGTGAAARFNYPGGVAVDAAGNVYVADTINHLIRKITSAGVVTTLAGTAGSFGSADGTGAAARFEYPYGVAVDTAGNVYVADTDNSTIRKISPGGVVTTLAGTAGTPESDDGTGAAARFKYPSGVAVDAAGNVYVADRNNHLIRKITSGGAVTTLAGSAGTSGSTDGTGAAARFNFPWGVAVDAAGNVYVADSFNYTIRKITSGGVVTTFAGSAGSFGSTDATGAAASFNQPAGVAVDTAGNVYVADYGNNTIRKIN